MISVAHKLSKTNESPNFWSEAADTVALYQEKDGYSHHRIITLPASSENVLLTFWQSKKHYREAMSQS